VSQEYVAGSCNIGAGEIRRRQIVAVAGAMFSLITLVGLVQSDTTPSGRLIMFLPFLVFATGFVQSRKRFCLAYGLAGTFNFGKLGEISKVADPVSQKADRKMAITILLQSFALALGLTLTIFVLPL
jgi:hypothetical protein